MKRIIRDRRLTPEEIAHYSKIREQIEQDLPELVLRHHIRDLIKELEGYALSCQNRALRLVDDGEQISDIERAKDSAAAGTYEYCIVRLKTILDK